MYLTITTQEKNIMISEFGSLVLGNDELLRIGIGTGAHWSSFTWGKQSRQDSIKAIQLSLEEGIRFIDTGAMYGKGYVEELIAEAIKGYRNKAFIATKIPEIMLQEGKIEEACDASLKRLDTDFIDLYQIHWINDLVDKDYVISELIKIKEKGKVRSLGMGNCGLQTMKKFPKDFVTNQLPYSLVWRGIENEILNSYGRYLDANIFYYCLGQGLLSGKYTNLDEFPNSRKRTRLFNKKIVNARHLENGYENELQNFLGGFKSLCDEYKVNPTYAALGWILYRVPNSIALVGLRNVDQVKEVSRMIKINDTFYEKLTKVSEELKNAVGSKLDLWDSEERIK